MLRSNQRDGTEQEEVPLGTWLGFLQRELGDWFPHCSVLLPDCWECVEASPHARFHSSYTNKLLFLDSFNSNSGLWNPNVFVIFQELFSRQVGPFTASDNASEWQTAGSSGWKMACWGQAGETGRGHGRFQSVPTRASLLKTFVPDASFLSETCLTEKLLDLEQVTQRFLHTAVRGG